MQSLSTNENTEMVCDTFSTFPGEETKKNVWFNQVTLKTL